MALNETEGKDGPGIKVNAEYNMQIFNFNSGKSIQREQQIKNDQPMEYFFSFDKNDLVKASAAGPVKKECKEKPKKVEDQPARVVKPGDSVKDVNVIHRVIKPAPTYIKEITADKGVANPVKSVEKKEEKTEVPAPEAPKVEEKKEETTEVEPQAQTKTNAAQDKTLSEEIIKEIDAKIA